MTTSFSTRRPGVAADPAPDGSLAFLRDGYLFGTRRFARFGRDAFRTKLMLKPVTVVMGVDAAAMFYEGDRFGRERAMPTSVLHLLQDEGSVQALDGPAHRRRKELFVRLLTDDAELARLRELFRQEWFAAMDSWPSSVVLHQALLPVLTRVALRWVGIDPAAVDVPAWTRDLAGMIDNAGRFGPPNWRARIQRRSAEKRAQDLIVRERAGSKARAGVPTAADTPLSALARFTEDGSPLSEQDTAVELLNILRPIVAVGRFMVFAALALHRHPRWRIALARGAEEDLEHVANEVRRFYPFFPVIGGRALRAFSWQGHDFHKGDWVLLDLYATNHDERLWREARRFRPDRFNDWNGDQNTLVPQGGGQLLGGHRCPGERATVELLKEALLVLTAGVTYRVPAQDLRVSLRRFPALPRSGFVIEDVARIPLHDEEERG